MEFHIPFFALRPIPRSDQGRLSSRKKCLRNWEDITLLTRDVTGVDCDEHYRLHRAQISCVVYGSDEWNWTAWAFEDTSHDWEDEEDVYADTLNGNVGMPFIEDPIAYGLDANRPIWRPREYFVKALDIRLRNVKNEWDTLVDMFELDRNKNVRGFIPSKYPC